MRGTDVLRCRAVFDGALVALTYPVRLFTGRWSMVQEDAARAAIGATNRRFEALFASDSPAAAARATYTSDARVLPPDMAMVRGREAIADFWTGAAQQLGAAGVTLRTVELEVHGDSAHEVGTATLHLPGADAHAKYVVLWKQEAGEWRWDVDIWNLGV